MNTSPQSYALLIGIDHYLLNTLNYSCLNGCVQDAIRIGELLQQTMALPDEHIIKLLAPNEAFVHIHESSPQDEQLPTYNAIVKAFQQILSMAQSGDFFYLYFAGHGARAAGLLVEDKEIDEVLVPMDIGNNEARYFHDVEFAYLLKKMEEAEIIVTVMLDCCFSGGTTRGGEGFAIRGRSAKSSDMSRRPGESSIASLSVLAQTWRRLPKGSLRGFHRPAPRGYVLLAACSERQVAYEYPADEHDGHGVFTYWLLEALHRLSSNTTYRTLHHRIQAKVQSEFSLQSPLLLGDADRLVFGSDILLIEPTINVIRVKQNKQLLLNIGSAHMVSEDATCAIYPSEVADFTQEEQCLAIVQIIHLGGTTSLAKVIKTFYQDPIEPGMHAILLDPGNILFQSRVRLFRDNIFRSSISQDEALLAVEQSIQQQRHKFVQIAELHERADYQVAVNENQMYEIWDSAGIVIPTIAPSLPIQAPESTTRLVHRLIHFTKYRNIQRLDNTDFRSPLAGKLEINLLGKQTDYEPGEKPRPEPFEKTGRNPTLKPEEWTFLQIKNVSLRELNIAVVNLAPDWSITKVFPEDETYHILASGASYVLDLQASLPEGLAFGTDTLKVFGTLDETDFKYLELPALDRNLRYHRGMTSPLSITPLAELLLALMEDTPKSRNFNTPRSHPAWEWVTAQLAIDVQQI